MAEFLPVGANPCLSLVALGVLVCTPTVLALSNSVSAQSVPQDEPVLVLEDFAKVEPDGFPQGWRASRSENVTRQAYQVQREGSSSFLRCKGVDSNVRIFKRTAWDPKAYPIVTWRWRLHRHATGTEPLGAVFVSLDEDFFGIPVNTKYIWSPNLAKGTLVEGGLFRPAQLVLRTGPEREGEWVEERVNAYEDFKRIHKHEPGPQAWGISLVAGPGVEIDFGTVAVARQ